MTGRVTVHFGDPVFVGLLRASGPDMVITYIWFYGCKWREHGECFSAWTRLGQPEATELSGCDHALLLIIGRPSHERTLQGRLQVKAAVLLLVALPVQVTATSCLLRCKCVNRHRIRPMFQWTPVMSCLLLLHGCLLLPVSFSTGD